MWSVPVIVLTCFLRVFAGVRLMRHTRSDVVAFERGVTRLPEVVACHHITGNFAYLLQVEVADLPAYEDFLPGA